MLLAGLERYNLSGRCFAHPMVGDQFHAGVHVSFKDIERHSRFADAMSDNENVLSDFAQLGQFKHKRRVVPVCSNATSHANPTTLRLNPDTEKCSNPIGLATWVSGQIGPQTLTLGKVDQHEFGFTNSRGLAIWPARAAGVSPSQPAPAASFSGEAA